MNLLADQGIDQSVVTGLRRDGHDVQAVSEIEQSTTDAAVLARARDAGAILLTAEAKADIVSAVLREHGSELRSAFTTVGPGIAGVRPQD